MNINSSCTWQDEGAGRWAAPDSEQMIHRIKAAGIWRQTHEIAEDRSRVRREKVKSNKRGTLCDVLCGPGPVNLGGELTVRHSALLVVDDAHSCCYNHLMTATANDRQYH